jgi:uncharacterized membrane protein
MTRTPAAALIVVPLCLFFLCWSLLHVGWLNRGQITDTGVYQRYGDAIVHGDVPYRDFEVEYPPGALPAFVLPSLGHEGDRSAYDRWFDREMLLCGFLALLGTALCLAALKAGPVRTAAALGVFALSPVLLGSVVLTRFDLWPAALAVLALATLLWRRYVAAAVLLGLAIGAKLWPLVLLPLAIVWLVRTRGPRAAAYWSGGVLAVLALVFLPFVVLSPGGIGHSFHVQLARPLQLESLGGSILIAVHHIAGTTLGTATTYGSQNLLGPGTKAVALATSIAGPLALAIVWAAFARGQATPERLVTHAAAAVAILLAFGKVFSPQYLMWLVPFVLLVPGLRGVSAAALLVAALMLTQSWFPHHYWALANSLASVQSAELLARNLFVLALAVVLVWPRSEHEMLGEHRSRLEALQRVRPQVQ